MFAAHVLNGDVRDVHVVRGGIEAMTFLADWYRATAADRGQTLAQMAIAWVLRDAGVASALIGASSVRQLRENVAALERLDFAEDELRAIDRFATDAGIDIWAASHRAG
jgi:L-glyceraldehyde 3-phosphate reductase